MYYKYDSLLCSNHIVFEKGAIEIMSTSDCVFRPKSFVENVKVNQKNKSPHRNNI